MAQRAQAPRRRRNTFGSVRKLPSGRFQASYWHDGKRYSGHGTFTSKSDADAWLANERTSIGRGAWVDPDAGRVLFRSYASTWLGIRSDLRPTTAAKYRSLLRLHLEPTFGDFPIANVARSAVRSWYHALAGEYQSTADDAYRLLRAIFNTAVRDELIVRSPCMVRGAGNVRSPERPVASFAEVEAAADAMANHLRVAVLLAAYCQLRRGEVLGLQRRDVDVLHGSLAVRRAVVLPTGASPLVGPPKTDAGIRTLSVPEPAWSALVEHLKDVDQAPNAWLIARDGHQVHPRTLDRAWTVARRSIGRSDLRWHDLRHSGLTWAAATGASTADLMRRGGHASPSAALRYQHATEDRDRALADALASLAHTSPTPLRARNAHGDNTPGISATAI